MMSAKPFQIDTLVTAASRLINVMNREVELLRAMRVKEISDMQGEKLELTALYEEALAMLASEPELLAALEPVLKEELALLANRFDAAVVANTLALSAVKDSHDRLLQTIVDSVAENRSKQKAYTADGALDNPRGGRNAPTLSLTLDQSL
jgi:hypothetical protein